MITLAAVALLAAATAQAPRVSQPAPPAAAERVSIWVTAKATGDRLAGKEPVAFESLTQPVEDFPTVIVDPRKRFQTIEGIGGALTDAAAETFAKLPRASQERLLEAYFDPEQGIGYTLGRTHINSCDFSSKSYAYADQPGDTALRSFTIEHDRRYRLPLVKAALARAGVGFKLFASPWSAPSWMKTNGDMLHGGKLRAEYRDAWARYYVRFVEEYEREGVPIWGLTVQNEPMATQTWESMLYTAEEERDFVRDHLGPVLERAGLARLKLMVWDHNRGIMYQRVKAVYDDPQAARYVWGSGFHWYVGDHFDNVRAVHDAWPDKQLLFTEGTPARFDPSQLQEWGLGETYGRSLVHDLNNWAAGWTDWNVLLDERGGPNHVGNFCVAPVHGDTRTGTLVFTPSYYYIGHFSKFVRPGARRIVSTSNDDALLTTAFVNPDGSVVAIVMNETGADLDFGVWVDNRIARTRSPAHSIVTLRW